MAVPEIPAYTTDELEANAAQFHRRYCGDPLEIPIDIEVILERDIGVDILPFPDLERQYSIVGMLSKDLQSNRPVVVIDENVMENQWYRYRFTLAEEYAHSVLHAEIFHEVRGVEEYQHLQQSLTNEEIWLMDRNARYLAGSLLIPASHVVALAKDLVPPQLDPLKALFRGVRDEELFRAAAHVLHEVYGVSLECMRYRLTNKAVRLDTWLVHRYRSR